MKAYDYGRREGIRTISWDEFGALTHDLAERLAAEGIELVVSVARTGLLPATAVASALRRAIVPIQLTRRVNDAVVHESPVWKAPVPDAVSGLNVAVIDEMTDTGETLRLAAEAVRGAGARRVVTASLAAHTWAAPPPDVVALTSDSLVLFPWDREVFMDGQWRTHPDLAPFLDANGSTP
jgi:hypothetical protein